MEILAGFFFLSIEVCAGMRLNFYSIEIEIDINLII